MFFFPRVPLPGLGPRTFLCGRCGSPVALDEDLVGILDRPETATYYNPYGIACEIRTFRRARNLEAADFSTDDHTWFEGYAWQPVGCARCGAHLGWKYDAVEPYLDPQSFFGLLTSALKVEAPSPAGS
jgi:hypothetical protein